MISKKSDAFRPQKEISQTERNWLVSEISNRFYIEGVCILTICNYSKNRNNYKKDDFEYIIL